MVMIANGPRYDFPFSDGDEAPVGEVVTLMLGIGFANNPESAETVKQICGPGLNRNHATWLFFLPDCAVY